MVVLREGSKPLEVGLIDVNPAAVTLIWATVLAVRNLLRTWGPGNSDVLMRTAVFSFPLP